MPFVERLATDEEKKRGIIAPDLLNKSTAELQQRFRKEFPDIARRADRRSPGRKLMLAGPPGQARARRKF